jgi:hypothetical protein
MKNLMKSKRGQGMIEYVIILAAVVALAFFLVDRLKKPVEDRVTEIETKLK